MHRKRMLTLMIGPFGVTQTRTLSGFRSRWVIPRLCRKATALQSCRTTLWSRWASGGLDRRYRFKSPPSQYSITSHSAKQRRGLDCSSSLWAGLFLVLFRDLFGVVESDNVDVLSWSFALAWTVLVLSCSLEVELLLLFVLDWTLFPS